MADQPEDENRSEDGDLEDNRGERLPRPRERCQCHTIVDDCAPEKYLQGVGIGLVWACMGAQRSAYMVGINVITMMGMEEVD